MSTIRIKGDTSGYIDLSAGSNDGALDISSSVTGAPVRTHSDLELETGGIHVKNPAGIEGLIVDEDTTNAAVSGRIVLKNSTDASSVYYSNTLGWTFHTGTILGNTSGTQRMYITPQGYQRLPYQPAFSIYGDTNPNYTSDVIYLGHTGSGAAAFDVNIGNHFSYTTGKFTAPVAGTYFFSFRATTADTNQHFIDIHKNGTRVGGHTLSYSNAYLTATNTCILTLASGDYIEARRRASGYSLYTVNFSGYLIG